MDIKDLENRFSFHPASSIEIQEKHEAVRNRCLDVACLFNAELPEGREKSIVMTKLEEVMFWANAAIARNK